MPERKTTEKRNSAQFAAVCEALLERGARVRFRASGQSMQPNILHGDAVVVARARSRDLHQGDVALTRGRDGFRVHRVSRAHRSGEFVITRGDAGQQNDAAPSEVLGKVIEVQRGGRVISSAGAGRDFHALRTQMHRLVRAGASKMRRFRGTLAPSLLILVALLLHAAPAAAQTLTITDTAAPTSLVGPGATITYTQVLKNTGALAVTHPFTVTESVPVGTTFVSAAKTAGTDTWGCVNTAGTITCTDTSGAGTYTTGLTTTFTVVVAVPAGTANGTVITGTTVSAKGNNTATATATAPNVTVQTPDLSVTETALPNPVATGANITYSETVTNGTAASAAGGATLTQNTPAGTLFVSATAPAGWACGTKPAVGATGAIICTATGNFATGSVVFTVVVSVSPETVVGSTITNSVTVSETGTDPNLANNTATASVQVQGADLSMTQSASVIAIAPGGTITYTETITNNGPNAATAAVLYQQTPPNTTFASINPPVGWTCGTAPAVGATGIVLCTANAAMNSGTTTGAFTFIVTVNAGTAAGTTIINSADVTSQTTDPVPSNNATTTNIPVRVEIAGDADLALSMTVSPTPVFISSNLTYTIQIQDLGLSNTTDGSMTDTIPPGSTFVSSATTQGSCSGTSTVTCTLGAITRGPTIIITITVTAPATPTTLTNTSSVTSSTTDPVLANNSVTVLTVVQPLVCASPGRDGSGGTLTGIVNAYYPPASAGTLAAGATSVALGPAAALPGAQTPIAAGDLLLFIQPQDAAINSTNTGAYGDGSPGDPASGWTSLNNSGNFEFVTATSAIPVTGGTVSFLATGAGGGLLNTYTSAAYIAGTQGQRTYQVIRVPQYTSALLSSGLTAMIWNGATGGVLSIDVASQLTLGGTVAVDALGFRGGAGRILGGGAGLATDYVTLATVATDASKGEGIAGTPRYVVNGTIASLAQTATDTTVEGLPNGSYSRGAPGNAGGGATDADPAANDQNSGGGGGGNGGSGGTGGFGWNSAGVVGGFGGTAFAVSTSALSMGGGAGAGTTNNGSYWNPITDTGNNNCGANCTGIYSSGAAGGGIVIIHAGAIIGSGTISANGQTALTTENDGGGGGGAGGTILVFASSGGFGGLTANANGGTGGTTWPEQAPGAVFPGNRHGPGAGGGGGAILATATPGSTSVNGGNPGVTTLANDAYGATPGQPGVVLPGLSITQTPGTQSGSYCGGADLAVTNAGSPNPVLAGTGLITYTQSVRNNGPFDALNAVFSETIPANTTFQSLSFPGGSGWTCATPGVGGTGVISCTNPDFAKAASTTFTVGVGVNSGVPVGSVITDVVNATAGSSDPNLANNTATVQTTVGLATTADLSITNTATPNPVIAGNNVTYTVIVTNNGAATASNVAFSEAIPATMTYVSATPSPAAGWTCSVVSGTLTCSNPTLATGASTTFTVLLKVIAGTASGTSIPVTANVSSTTTDPNPNNNSAVATVIVATAGQADLSVLSSATPNPVTDANNITYTQSVTNNGPAASGVATFSDAIPAGTTFVSFAVPAGWNCGATIPAVGGTGTISCTIASLALNATANFPLVVKASLGDTPGTTITNTANINVPCSSASDPNCANNSASTNVVVASPTQADVAIMKTANPDPVDQGTNLQYTLQVTNNGPAAAQGVMVTDPIPSEFSFTSVSTTQGTCTYDAPTTTVNCSLGSVNVGGLVLITINATAVTFNSAATNTATVSATTGDPNLTNNTASVSSTIAAPTAVRLASFRAMPRQGGGVLLEWKTREESRDLGFNVFRLDGPARQRLNPSIIAGSALLIRGGRPQHAAKTYQWFDESGTPQSTYELEDVDLNGTRMSHGPVSVDVSAAPRSGAVAEPLLVTQLNRATAQPALIRQRGLAAPQPVIPPRPRGHVPVPLDEEAAVKISVQSEGWYQVSKAQLVAAGLEPNADARTLQLYAEGVEQPLLILGRQAGPLGPNDGIEFYGTGIDTPFSGTRVYWLIRGSRPGMRIASIPALNTGISEPQSFPFTVVLEQRTTYFATLLNGENNDNFFGALVLSKPPVDQQLTVAHADPNSSMQITVDVTLQGVTDQQAHRVSVLFNGTPIGEMDFANLANVTNTFSIDRSVLEDGINTVTLTSLEGDNDISLVQSIALHYPHTYAADANWLKATAPAGSTLHIGGFTNQQIQVFDITNPLAIEQLSGTVGQDSSAYGITLGLPPTAGPERTLLVFSEDQIAPPSGLAFHKPAALAAERLGSQMVIITHPDFESALAPLVRMHESRGHSVEVVTIDEVFDAFNYGERSPLAIRDFLENAESRWSRKPQYLLLVGDASVDPRNYLGLGDFDFVPTRIIETAAFKTATDDWFSDFKQNGFETIATGRIPVRTASDAALVVSKIVNYEKGPGASQGNQQALLVADQNIDADFTTATKFAAADLPSSLQPTEILADGLDPSVVRQQILSALNSGPLLVNYSGHGSVEQWSFADFLDDSSAANLTNGDQLSVYLLMDCLNGFFHDVYTTSLAESLLLAPNGGAVAVWASSGFTDQAPQASMNQALLQILKTNPSMPIAAAIVEAKAGVADNDVRRTWIFFGDPAMLLELPASSPTGRRPPVLGNPPVRHPH